MAAIGDWKTTTQTGWIMKQQGEGLGVKFWPVFKELNLHFLMQTKDCMYTDFTSMASKAWIFKAMRWISKFKRIPLILTLAPFLRKNSQGGKLQPLNAECTIRSGLSLKSAMKEKCTLIPELQPTITFTFWTQLR